MTISEAAKEAKTKMRGWCGIASSAGSKSDARRGVCQMRVSGPLEWGGLPFGRRSLRLATAMFTGVRDQRKKSRIRCGDMAA